MDKDNKGIPEIGEDYEEFLKDYGLETEGIESPITRCDNMEEEKQEEDTDNITRERPFANENSIKNKWEKNSRVSWKVTFIIVSILLAASLGFNVLEYVDNERLQTEKERMLIENGKLETEVKTSSEEIDRLRDVVGELTEKAFFMDDHVVIVPDDGRSRYHKYGCGELDLDYFWAYNEEAAISLGFRACPECN